MVARKTIIAVIVGLLLPNSWMSLSGSLKRIDMTPMADDKEIGIHVWRKIVLKFVLTIL
jgi:hypothetical protein